MWIIFSSSDAKREQVQQLLTSWQVEEEAVWCTTPQGLRDRVQQCKDRWPHVIIAMEQTDQGLIDINVAAAITKDACADAIFLLAEHPSGSYRSRAQKAGVREVLDIEDVLHKESSAPMCIFSTSEQWKPLQQVSDKVWPSFSGYTKHAPVICIASGRGGVGKTTIATLMASEAAHRGLMVDVVDLDLGGGNVATAFGAEPQDLMVLAERSFATAEEVLRQARAPNKHLRLWGPVALPEYAERVSRCAVNLIHALKRTSDLVIIDTSTQISDVSAAALQIADRVLVIEDSRNPRAYSTARLCGLIGRLGLARTRLVRVQNFSKTRISMRYKGEAAVPEELKAAQVYELKDGGADITALLARGEAYSLTDIGGTLPDGIAHLTTALLQELGVIHGDLGSQEHKKHSFALFGR